MNSQKTTAVLIAIGALILPGCGKEDSWEDADTNDPTSIKEGVPDALESQSATPPESIQERESDASQTAPQQVRQRIMADIVEIIGKPEGGLTRDHWRKIKERYWLPSFDRSVRGSDDATTIRELLATPRGGTPLVVQLLSGSFGTRDPAETDALLAFHNMALVTAAMGGASLPSALADRRNDPDIIQGDVMMFEVFNDAFQDVPRSETLSQAAWQEWKQLAESPNDLIRLLALRTFSSVAPQPEQWLDFYQLYVGEPDYEILAEVADKLFETAKPEAAKPLTEIRSRSEPPLPAEFAAKLDRSIEFLSQLPSRPK